MEFLVLGALAIIFGTATNSFSEDDAVYADRNRPDQDDGDQDGGDDAGGSGFGPTVSLNETLGTYGDDSLAGRANVPARAGAAMIC